MKPTEEKVLNYIKQYHEEHSLMPTVREIRAGVGLKSTGSVQYVLKKLREQGLIAEANKKSRSCQIVGDSSLTFKAKWDKLKEWLDEDITNGEYYFKIINKMKELENGERNEIKSPKIS